MDPLNPRDSTGPHYLLSRLPVLLSPNVTHENACHFVNYNAIVFIFQI